jgi:hypothetical protein
MFLNREPWGKAPPTKHKYIKRRRESSTYNRPNQRLGEQKEEKSEKRAIKGQLNKAKTVTRLGARARWKGEDLL